MANYRYPNLTIINESDLHDANPNFFSNTIQQQFQVDIDVQDISKYGVDYFIRAHSSDASARMLARGFANVSTYTLTLMPWTPDYGSTTVPLHTQDHQILLPRTERKSASNTTPTQVSAL
ncbi:unnamed protein product [Miscanthus lutarioriparius]|uniref:Uncharacterized protein n=1 Tax=Miscanthus lutarioriparius TaxID=422564 RepID=A0A811P251_9POAL|nr:unnamed protein product [Miscanthus lutarioriparius]